MKIDRTKWKPCEFCRNDDGRKILSFDGAGDSIIIEIDNWLACIESDSFGFLIEYCPKYGRPLTEQAWQELERRFVYAD